METLLTILRNMRADPYVDLHHELLGNEPAIRADSNLRPLFLDTREIQGLVKKVVS